MCTVISTYKADASKGMVKICVGYAQQLQYICSPCKMQAGSLLDIKFKCMEAVNMQSHSSISPQCAVGSDHLWIAVTITTRICM